MEAFLLKSVENLELASWECASAMIDIFKRLAPDPGGAADSAEVVRLDWTGPPRVRTQTFSFGELVKNPVFLNIRSIIYHKNRRFSVATLQKEGLESSLMTKLA